jgi:RNA polymerase sigma-70 factor (ECF subfamily)
MSIVCQGAEPDDSGERNSPLDDQLESVREYLRWVAERTLDSSLTAKLGASDVVQETLIEAHRRAPTYRGHCLAQLRAWLESILKHRIAREKRFLRAAKRDARRETTLTPDGSRQTIDPADSGASPSGQFMRRELMDALVVAIDRLPEHYRQVVRLRHEERWTFEQIGAELNVSPDAACKLWARALVRLRDTLRAGHDPG